MTLQSLNDEGAFLDLLRRACVLFGAAHILIAFLTRGAIHTSESRFEVLSAATIPSFAIIGVGVIKRLSKLDMFIIILNLSISLLSVTRTLLAVLAIQLASMFIARPSLAFKRSTLRGLSLFAFALLLVLALDYGSGTGLALRWIQRITVAQKFGADPTALTRTAEAHYMLQSLQSSPENFLFGSGLAAVTSLTGPDAQLAAKLVGRQSISLHSIGFGHENYISILFVAGIFGGGGLILLQIFNAFQSMAVIRKIAIGKFLDTEAADRVGLWGALIVIGELSLGLFSGTMGDRDTCLWMGIGTGMLYWSRYRFKATAANSAS